MGPVLSWATALTWEKEKYRSKGVYHSVHMDEGKTKISHPGGPGDTVTGQIYSILREEGRSVPNDIPRWRDGS